MSSGLSRTMRWMFAIKLTAIMGCTSLSEKHDDYHEFVIRSKDTNRSPVIDTTHHPILDRIEYTVEWPKRLFGGVDTNEDRLTPETVEKLQQYLADGGLDEVSVVFNEYSPSNQWQRLRRNKQMPAEWKYSIGTARLVAATIFPARVFDRNVYNPFTNTLEINSDQQFKIITQLVMAHRLNHNPWGGFHASLVQLPPVGMMAQLRAGFEAVEYAKRKGDWELEQSGYHELYPQAAMTCTMAATPFVPFYTVPVMAVGGQLIGSHIANRKIESRQNEIVHAEFERTALVASEVE